MKLNKTLVSALLAIALSGFSYTAHADDSANEVKFEVKKYNLTGFYDKAYSEPEFRAQIVGLLRSYVGKDVTLAKIDELKSKLQALLNTRAKGLYTISVPPQKLENGEVTLRVNFLAGKITYADAPGYSKENVKRSLPSIREGLYFVAGRPFVDERELTMAVENPLKLTQIEYDIKPGQPINVHVNVIAPNGKTLRYVQVDNSGSGAYDYVRGTVGYVNSNLTGKDDVFAAVATSNFKSWSKYNAFAVSYTRPLYKTHQRFDVTLAHTSSAVDNLVDNSLLIKTVGRGDIAQLNWSYYLPHYDWSYANQLKVQAGYTFRRLYASARDESNESVGVQLSDSKVGAYRSDMNVYYASPLYVGLTGRIIPKRGMDMEVSLRYNWFYSGFLGSSDVNVQRAFNNRRVTGEKFQDWITGSLHYRVRMPKNWTWYQIMNFQYSNKHLFATERYSTGVRGFRDGGVAGDKGVTVKTEIITPNLYDNITTSLKAYGFVDLGYGEYNHDPKDAAEDANPTLAYKPTVNIGKDGKISGLAYDSKSKNGLFHASTGLGVRFAYKQFSLDTYYVRNLTRVKSDLEKESRNSVFFSAIYRW